MNCHSTVEAEKIIKIIKQDTLKNRLDKTLEKMLHTGVGLALFAADKMQESLEDILSVQGKDLSKKETAKLKKKLEKKVKKGKKLRDYISEFEGKLSDFGDDIREMFNFEKFEFDTQSIKSMLTADTKKVKSKKDKKKKKKKKKSSKKEKSSKSSNSGISKAVSSVKKSAEKIKKAAEKKVAEKAAQAKKVAKAVKPAKAKKAKPATKKVTKAAPKAASKVKKAKPASKKAAPKRATAKKPAAKKVVRKVAAKKTPATKKSGSGAIRIEGAPTVKMVTKKRTAPAAAKKTVAKKAAPKKAAPKKSAPKKVAPKKAAPKKSVGGGDDLKLITGIGPKLEQKLKSMGIKTYGDVANISKTKLDEVRKIRFVNDRPETQDWKGQAKKLMKKK